ncbi:MAG: MFS transporter [Gammaproteobacteria bacterium]|nr:MFS transporter [Gammaproteobacteria bacterium]
MLAALTVPKIIDQLTDKIVMVTGAFVMGAGVLAIAANPGLTTMLPVWFAIGLGWSLVQTPAGRVVNRSARPSDRAAYFSAQFALSHACWLLAYPLAGQLGARFGIDTTALWMGSAIVVLAGLAGLVWPRHGGENLEHEHDPVDHLHRHTHGQHHQHDHRGDEGPEPHSHPHYHPPVRHAHNFVIDEHHLTWPKPRV